MYKSIAKKGAGLDGALVESIRIEGDSIIVSARPRKRTPRRPVCGGRCDAYDRLPARRWRALDDGALKRYVECVTPIHRNSRSLLKKKFNSDAKMRIVLA